MSRPRPVLIYGIAVAVLSVISESADAADLLPDRVFPWIRLTLAIAAAVGGALWTQRFTTPVSDPQDNEGRPLVPVPDGSRVIGLD